MLQFRFILKFWSLGFLFMLHATLSIIMQSSTMKWYQWIWLQVEGDILRFWYKLVLWCNRSTKYLPTWKYSSKTVLFDVTLDSWEIDNTYYKPCLSKPHRYGYFPRNISSYMDDWCNVQNNWWLDKGMKEISK